MSSGSDSRIAVLAGDGIGVEVMRVCLEVLEALGKRFGLRFAWNHLPGGANTYLQTGSAFSDDAMREVERADAILFGAMGLPDVRYPDGTEIAPQLDIRTHLELYAGVRPIRCIPGLPGPLRDERAARIDLVILREQTEGLYWSRGRGVMEDEGTALDTMRITRTGAARVFDYAFELARQRQAAGRPGRVTCVDKAGVLRSMAFFRSVFQESAALRPEFASHCMNVDAMALDLVRRPWDYDVIVTENMFGDILSDLGAGIIGGMGFAPSGDVGDRHAMFQPCHGTAPDIAGTGKANPTAMFLSAAMMLEWLAQRNRHQPLAEAARLLRETLDAVFAQDRLLPFDAGGGDGTRALTNAVLDRISRG